MLVIDFDIPNSRCGTPGLIQPRLPRVFKKMSTPSPLRRDEGPFRISQYKKLTAKDFVRPPLLRSTPIRLKKVVRKRSLKKQMRPITAVTELMIEGKAKPYERTLISRLKKVRMASHDSGAQVSPRVADRYFSMFMTEG